MPRRLKSTKPLIYVFCEGESEQAYTDFLKKRFEYAAAIKRPSKTGLFEEADASFRKDQKFRDAAEVMDEIWFFFDVESDDIGKWAQRYKIIKRLRALRKGAKIRVRLLMTTGCMEYWLMLHYKFYSPPIVSVSDKERILEDIIAQEPAYAKGNYPVTARIAEHYPTAVHHAKRILYALLQDGLPELEDTDERNQWLYTNCKTFSTVYEAIEYLEQLPQ